MELDEAFSPADTRVGAKILDGELIVINFDTGYYYASTGTGVVIWRQIEAGGSLRQVTDALVRHYDVAPEQAERDARAFLEKLALEGLLQPGAAVPAPDSPPGESAAERPPYAPPELVKFDDMAELFAIDPPLVIKSRNEGGLG